MKRTLSRYNIFPTWVRTDNECPNLGDEKGCNTVNPSVVSNSPSHKKILFQTGINVFSGRICLEQIKFGLGLKSNLRLCSDLIRSLKNKFEITLKLDLDKTI